MQDVVDLLTRAFSAIHPRFRFEFAAKEDAEVEVTVIALDDAGDIAEMVQQSLPSERLAADPRARAFVEGAAIRTRVRVEQVSSRSDAMTWLMPKDLLPLALLDAPELTTAEAFVAAGGPGFSLLARLETLALCDELAERMPEAMAAVKRDDDRDLALVDAMFAMFSERFGTGHTLTLVRQAGADDRRHLAPLLIAWLHETARDEDLQTNAWLKQGKKLTRPIAHDAALRQLVQWGVDVGDLVGGWLAAGVISSEYAGEARRVP